MGWMGEGDVSKTFKTFFQASSMSWQQFMWKNIFFKPNLCLVLLTRTRKLTVNPSKPWPDARCAPPLLNVK